MNRFEEANANPETWEEYVSRDNQAAAAAERHARERDGRQADYEEHCNLYGPPPPPLDWLDDHPEDTPRPGQPQTIDEWWGLRYLDPPRQAKPAPAPDALPEFTTAPHLEVIHPPAPAPRTRKPRQAKPTPVPAATPALNELDQVTTNLVDVFGLGQVLDAAWKASARLHPRSRPPWYA
jgi:hypothetical protein